MGTQIDVAYGAPRTIRYLVTSVDDLREVAVTVLYIIRHSCQKDDCEDLINGIKISAVPMPQSLSSFILGLEVPCKILERASRGTAASSAGIDLLKSVGESGGNGNENVEINVKDGWSHFQFELKAFSELIRAVDKTIHLLQTNTKKFEFVNLKRRTRLKASPNSDNGKGFRLQLQVPKALEMAAQE